MLQTTDIYLAAALMSLGAKLEDVNRDDPRHMEFKMEIEPPKFESKVLIDAVSSNAAVQTVQISTSPSLTDYEKSWMNGELMVNAVKFAEAIKRMKSVVHSR